MLQEAANENLDEAARRIVSERRVIPGLGHPTHKGVDPRVPRLFAVAAENGFAGRHVDLIQKIAAAAGAARRRALPVNATGAIGAIATELKIPWQVTRGLAVMARAIGLVAHLQEEVEDPLATEIWTRVDEESSNMARGGSRIPHPSGGAPYPSPLPKHPPPRDDLESGPEQLNRPE
jgi:citrate synthase